MTTDEIKKMIADTLQGQGNQVDIGGGIPKILNAIVEKIDEGGGGGGETKITFTENPTLLQPYYKESLVEGQGAQYERIPKDVLLTSLGITENDLSAIMSGEVAVFLDDSEKNLARAVVVKNNFVQYSCIMPEFIGSVFSNVAIAGFSLTLRNDGAYNFSLGKARWSLSPKPE